MSHSKLPYIAATRKQLLMWSLDMSWLFFLERFEKKNKRESGDKITIVQKKTEDNFNLKRVLNFH